MSYYRESIRSYVRFLRFLAPYRGIGLLAGALMLLSSGLQLPMPLLMRYLIDVVVPARNLTYLSRLIFLLIGILLLSQVLIYLEKRLLVTYKNHVQRDLRTSLFKKLLTTRQSTLERETIGYFQARVDSDVDAISSLLMDTLLGAVVDILTLAVGVSLLFYFNAELALVGIMSLPAFILCYHLFSKRIHALAAKRQDSWARLRGTQVELAGQARVIKSFNRSNVILSLFATKLGQAIESDRILALTNVVATIAIGLTGAVLPFFILWYGIRQIILGGFTLGGFVAFNSCVGFLYGPVQNLAATNIAIQAALASAQRIFEILSYEEDDASFGTISLHEIQSVRLQEVSYVYDREEKRGLENVSLSLERGNVMAVVGATGGGKSTLGQLLVGLRVPTSGRILFNSVDYTQYDLAAIRTRIGYVPQEPDLLSGSIRDNITFFETSTDRALLDSVVAWCVLEQTIRRCAKRLDTHVLEAGGGLSGGEKQRIAIARALYRKPDLLILDESTSALDIETEKELMPHLLHLPWRPAVLLITHRRSFLHSVDKVLSLS